MLDANIPIEIAAIDNSKNPNIITKVGTIFGEPKYINIAKYIKLITNVISTTIDAAKNFPRTIPVTLLGDVSSNCSVPFFLSHYESPF